VTDLQQLTSDAAHDGIEKLVAGAIVHHSGRILILRRSPADPFMPGIEELPSGGVDKGEDLLTALRRELKEETGLTGPLTVDRDFTASFDYESGSGRKTRQHTFAVPYNGHPIRLSREHVAFRWINPADTHDTDLTRETTQTIRDWAAGTAEDKPE
jgi:8-oxo-dGTP diphosphatase